MHKYTILLLIFLFGCSQKKIKNIQLTPSFYFWKTTFNLSGAEVDLLKKTGASPMYIRFFDIDWQPGQGAVPVAQLEIGSLGFIPKNIVPVIFITNRTMKKTAGKDIALLADRILKKIAYIADKFSISVHEVQFDCDWTESSKQHFFDLIKAIKQENQGIIISSTLRLHQYRYPQKTGIPPVDKVMLMFYNMGEVSNINEPNSILNLAKARPYIEGAKPYPIPLDIAVPIFGWGALFREGKLINLLKGIKGKDLKDPLRFTKTDETHFDVIKDTYLEGNYLYKNDQIRLEEVSETLLLKTVPLLRQVINQPKTCIAFYHLDISSQKEFSNATIRHFFNQIQEK